MQTAKSILGRAWALLLTLWGATFVTFLISRLIPTDVARLIAGDGASPEVVARLRVELGLDLPIWRQYLHYLQDLAHGDLGVSIRTGAPVADELFRAAPATTELALAAFALTVFGSVALAVLSALHQGGWVDQWVRGFCALSISAPTFWVGMLLIWLLAAQLGWAPTGGRLDPGLQQPPLVTGLLTVDALLAGRPGLALDAAAHLSLPALTLALGAIGASTRLLRASLMEALQSDYVRRARASGLSQQVIITHYAFPNAAIPYVTTLGLRLADLLVGAVVTEAVFGWPGLGSYVVEAIAGLDFPAIMGFTLFAATAYACVNAAADAANVAIDPRARSAAT